MELLKSINHPEEVMALIKFKLGGCDTVMPKCDFESMSPRRKKCYDFLNKTSRSFSAVIQALDGDLRHAVCIFYLVLRALDTVEDDMTIPPEEKIPLLKTFYQKLQDPEWSYHKSQEKDRLVLEDFPTISGEFRSLAPVFQEVISDICRRMGEGMTKYLDKAPDTMEEWDEYCHYVAGLVGIGLSQLFSGSKLEEKIVGEDTRLSNSMGLFLQKTNIIRDYLEDVEQGRYFWPKQAWGKYCKDLKDLAQPHKREEAMACLNELITNALQHIPDCLEYMSRLKNQSVFNFCAIPQVMAIGTLERCYNNPQVFTGVVKIRKGEAVRMMMEATSLDSVKAIMTHFTTKVQKEIPMTDPLASKTHTICDTALSLSHTPRSYESSSYFFPIYVSCAMLVGAIIWQYGTNIMSVYDIFTGQEDDR